MKTAQNKKVRFDYDVIESFEAGIVLSGAEAKSIKTGGVSMVGSRVVERDGVLYLIGMNVPKYRFANMEEYDPTRSRKLLIHKKEMLAIKAKREGSGLTLVPVRLYNKGALIKVEVGLVRGKKQYEKRDAIKKRTEDRWLARQTKKVL